MKKVWILSIFVLAMACLLAVGASAVDYQADITDTGLAVNGTEDIGIYKAGDGTVKVSFDGSDTCYIEVNNATIDLGSSDGYAIYSPYPTTVTITGNTRFIGVDAIKVEGGSITLKDSSVTGGSFIADSIILEGSSTLDAVIINFDEGNLAVSAGSTVSGLLAARHDYGGSGGFYNTIQCVGDVVIDEDAVIEVALLSINDFTFEAGATLTLNGELRNGYSDIDPEEMKAWAERVKNHLSGPGLIQIGQDYADYYATDGEQIPGMLTLDDENGGGKNWSWNASTKTLTLEDGFRCMEEIEFKVSGDITVIVKGKAYVGEDFETDGEGIIATVTIQGPGTLTVHDEFEMSNDSRLSLIIAKDATVIAEEEVDLYSLTVNGTFEVRDNDSPLIDIRGGTLTVSQTGKLRVNNTDPAPGDVAIQFSDVTSPDGLCNIAGTTLTYDEDNDCYILADENGTPFKSFHPSMIVLPTQGAATSDVNTILLLVLLKHSMQEYTVTLTASEGGSITGNESVRWARSSVYTITPDEGWTLVSLYLDGKEIEPTQTLKLTRVKADHTIEAVFAPIEEIEE